MVLCSVFNMKAAQRTAFKKLCVKVYHKRYEVLSSQQFKTIRFEFYKKYGV